MDNFKITEQDVRECCIEGKGNPLSSNTVEENQAVFDAFPKMIAKKFNTFLVEGTPKLLEDAVSAAASYATTKADAAETNAKAHADTAASDALDSAKKYADTKKQEAVSAAASDATTKADAAETNAKAYANTVATDMANVVLASAKAYAKGQSDAVMRSAMFFSSVMHGACESPRQSEEISDVYFGAEDSVFSLFGNLLVSGVRGGTKIVFFNPLSEEMYIATVSVAYSSDTGYSELNFSDFEASFVALDRNAFVEKFPFYGVYTGESYKTQAEIMEFVKAYADGNANTAEEKAKEYADEKIKEVEALVSGEKTIVLPIRLDAGTYNLPDDCVGVKSVVVQWDETLTGANFAYVLLGDDSLREYANISDAIASYEFLYENGLTQEIVFEGFENRSDVTKIGMLSDLGEVCIVSITYYAKSQANEYTDVSIQQAILDSWEVGV